MTTPNPLRDDELRRHAQSEPWQSLDEADYLVEIRQLGDTEQRNILRTLQRRGVCLIRWEAEPPSDGRILSFEQWLGPIRPEQNDFKGKLKAIKPNDHAEANTGDSRKALPPHVDGTQDKNTPALLVFQYQFGATWGGQSTFYDLAAILSALPGDQLNDILLSLAREGCGTCTKTKELKDGTQWTQSYTGPLIKPVCGDRGVAVRFRPDNLLTAIPDCQAALRALQKAVADWPYKLSYMPQEGDIVVFDNWRVLHGREAVGGRHQRIHDRMWIDRLDQRWDGKFVLGIRPIPSDLMTNIIRANGRP